LIADCRLKPSPRRRLLLQKIILLIEIKYDQRPAKLEIGNWQSAMN